MARTLGKEPGEVAAATCLVEDQQPSVLSAPGGEGGRRPALRAGVRGRGHTERLGKLCRLVGDQLWVACRDQPGDVVGVPVRELDQGGRDTQA